MVPVIILGLFSFIICKGVNASLEISDPSVELRQCVSHTMEELFCEAFSVYVAQDDHDYDISTLSPKIPHVFIDVYQSMRGHTWGYGYNFLILAQNVSSLSSLLENLTRSNVWNYEESALGRILVVTLSQDVQTVFKLLWQFNILNALVVVKENEEYNVYSSDPFHPKNTCGAKVEGYVKQKCSRLVIEFPKPLRNLNGCPLVFDANMVPKVPYMAINNSFVYFSSVLNTTIMHKELIRASNMEMLKINNTAILKFAEYLHPQYGDLKLSSEIYDDYFVYVSPVDHNLFTLHVVVALFQYEVWIAIIVVFFITWLVWWIILKIKKSPNGGVFCDVFMEICSSSTCGCIRRIPKIGILRAVFLFYLFYIIVIQTAFKTNLIRALTSPIDSNKIESMENVANSKLNVCIYDTVEGRYFWKKKPLDDIYTKIQNKLTPVSDEDPVFLFKEKKCILLITNAQEFLFLSKHGESSTVIEDRYTKTVKILLMSPKPHYVMASINAAIERWKESGIYEADIKKMFPKSTTNTHEDDEPVVLTLQHLSGVFAIWGICISFAYVVFIAELVVHKFLTK